MTPRQLCNIDHYAEAVLSTVDTTGDVECAINGSTCGDGDFVLADFFGPFADFFGPKFVVDSKCDDPLARALPLDLLIPKCGRCIIAD